MTVVNTTPPLGAPTTTSSAVSTAPNVSAPDSRELSSIAVVTALVAAAQLTDFGPWVLASWLPGSLAAVTPMQSLALVCARFGGWLLGAIALSIVFSLRWTPRLHQRLLEPSLIASWVTLAAAVAVALTLNRFGAWPWTWASTAPDIAVAISAFANNQHYLAIGLWLVCACLIVPLLTELFFRHAVIEFLRRQGVSSALAVAIASVTFAASYIATWPWVAGAVLQHAGVTLVLGAVLGTLAVRGKRGRGLGLAIIAHGAFVATELGVLVRSLPTG